MKPSDIKTLKELEKETGIPAKTLMNRFRIANMIENEDYKSLGPRQPIILFPSGVEKIINKGGN